MKRKLSLIILGMTLCLGSLAQRLQHLGRGVVATYHSSTGVTVSWRRLIQDPEDALYNVYVRKGGEASPTRLNAEPLSLTNYNVVASLIPDGSEIQVFTGQGKITVSGQVTVLPEQPLPGYAWDASTLADDGTLRMVPTTDIRSISADGLDKAATVYDLHGRQLKHISTPGIYIINNNKVYIRP